MGMWFVRRRSCGSVVMVTRIVLLICFSSVVGCTKEKTKWMEVGDSPEMHVYIGKRIEMGSKAESPFVGVSMLWDYHQPKVNPAGMEYRSFETKLLVDCKRMLAADAEYSRYSGQMATGNKVDSGERDLKEAERELREIQGSATKEVANMACNRAGKLMNE